MSHNNNFIFGLHQLTESLCLDSCFHTGILLYLLGLSSVISDLVFRLHDCLITASGKRQVHGTSGIFHTIHISSAIRTNTDT